MRAALATAIAEARSDGVGLFQCVVETQHGPVDVLAEAVFEHGGLSFKDMAIYKQVDPPPLPRGSITRPLRGALRSLLRAADSMGYADVTFGGRRVPNSSSANPGKIVTMKRLT